MAADAISSHDVDYAEYVGPGLTWGRILSTCVISMWSNEIKCKYMFMFPLRKLARKGLNKNGICFAGHGAVFKAPEMKVNFRFANWSPVSL